MNVNAYAAKAAIRIGMNVAGQRDGEAVDEAVPMWAGPLTTLS